MALMLLGKLPHPETGETIREIDSARMFIDQLEMLALKTGATWIRRRKSS